MGLLYGVACAVKQEEKKKSYRSVMQKIKLSLFAEGISVNGENPKEYKRKNPKIKKWVKQGCRIQNKHTKIPFLSID